MKLKNILFAAALALSGAVATSNTASAFDLGGFVKDIGRGVSRTVHTVERAVSHEARVVVRKTVNSVRTVAHTATVVARKVEHTVAKAPKVYMAIAKPVGKAVAAYYRFGAKVIEHTPFKFVAPFARDAARAALSKSGKVGFAVGAGLAVVTGGASHLLLSAGAGGMTHYYGDKALDRAKATYARAKAQVRATYNGAVREARGTVRDIRTSLR